MGPVIVVYMVPLVVGKYFHLPTHDTIVQTSVVDAACRSPELKITNHRPMARCRQ